jgi:hypothetical protein
MRGLLFFSIFMITACGTAPRAHEAETDPAVADALSDPVLADPQLALQRGGGSQIGIPVGAAPDMALDMPLLHEVAKVWSNNPVFAGCDPKVGYAYAWMAKRPAALPLPVAAQVAEAAGSDSPKCAFRIVRYGISQLPADVAIAWRAAGAKAGFALSGSNTELRGLRRRDGAAFVMTVQPAGSGSSVDLVTRSTP